MTSETFRQLMLSWHWALVVALLVLIFGLRRGLCAELHRRGWLVDRVNRFSVGAVVLAIGAALDAATWGAFRDGQGLDLAIVPALRDLAYDGRMATRPLELLGTLLMISGLTDDLQETGIVVAVVAAVLLGTWLTVALA